MSDQIINTPVVSRCPDYVGLSVSEIYEKIKISDLFACDSRVRGYSLDNTTPGKYRINVAVVLRDSDSRYMSDLTLPFIDRFGIEIVDNFHWMWINEDEDKNCAYIHRYEIDTVDPFHWKWISKSEDMKHDDDIDLFWEFVEEVNCMENRPIKARNIMLKNYADLTVQFEALTKYFRDQLFIALNLKGLGSYEERWDLAITIVMMGKKSYESAIKDLTPFFHIKPLTDLFDMFENNLTSPVVLSTTFPHRED